jgi:putative hydrolase of the HAD superfamily
MYKHIFFDLDRTLWDFATNSHDTLLVLSEKYDFDKKGIPVLEFISDYHQINDALWDEYGKGSIDKEGLRYQRFYRALVKYGVDDDAIVYAMSNDYSAMAPQRTSLFPGTMEVLDYLIQKYPLHIITNGFEESQHTKMKNCGILPYFQNVITSEKAGYKKPHTGIFEYSVQLVGGSTETCIMIGDNLDADIRGAKAAGIHQVYFNPEGKEHAEEVTHEIRELRELMRIL